MRKIILWKIIEMFSGKNLVLTAAHCTKGDFRPDVVRLGAHNLALDN